MLDIFIPLEPYAMPRPRFGRGGHAHNTDKSRSWKQAAAIYMQMAVREYEKPVFAEGPVGVRLRFYFKLPKSAHRKGDPPKEQWHIGRMDFDNLAKTVCDAANGILWKDDRQVSQALIQKIRVAQDATIKWGVDVGVWELEELPVDVSDDLAVCSSCGMLYSPTRRPNPDRRNYCPKCKEDKVPQRDASRDYYDRKRR